MRENVPFFQRIFCLKVIPVSSHISLCIVLRIACVVCSTVSSIIPLRENTVFLCPLSRVSSLKCFDQRKGFSSGLAINISLLQKDTCDLVICGDIPLELLYQLLAIFCSFFMPHQLFLRPDFFKLQKIPILCPKKHSQKDSSSIKTQVTYGDTFFQK